MIRAALAATLSGLWGVYSGFELCEAAALPNSEEYLDSEKYQIRAWDWNRPGNIVGEITALNRIRRANPAGALRYRMELNDHLRDDTLFVYDLELPRDFEPKNHDGEIAEFVQLITRAVELTHREVMATVGA